MTTRTRRGVPATSMTGPAGVWFLTGLVAPALLVLGVVLAGLLSSEHHHRVHNVSDLGGTEASYPLVLNTTFVIVGALLVAFAAALGRAPNRDPVPVTVSGAWLIGIFGLSLMVQAFTPCTPGCAAGTSIDQVHAAAALVGILAIVAATILTARRSRGTTRYRRGSLLAGIAVLALLGSWLATSNLDAERFHAGVHQRLLVAVVLCWLTATAITGLRQRVAPSPTSSAPPR